MNNIVSNINKFINTIFIVFSLLFLAVLTGSIAVQVYTRYILGASMTGTEELARYSFIWLTMLGASICINENAHATVTLLNDKLTGNLKRIHNLTCDAMVMIAVVVLFIYGLKMVFLTTNQLTPSLQIPMAIVYLSLPVGAFGMIIGTFHNFLKHYKATAKGENE
ncbi:MULTISPECIES: TRAP transporter small permease [unclassified Sporosarcina]|uniref:TRAP transporter small permease n=1 Tax=unclassified Sporosarcina TaxID=2647733 RepID=UPI002040B768|nr:MULTISPECIES: TRAP transporter small permease [unclassified Sporosarcina]GKV65198.1 hypothetical protein NCCP2331_13510 [Sporosarcina sp. NCCP-2331]GLB55322.1 hypothetical protein NCCP2378_11080 [Sporosarcina sp. NCCP-2378]